MSVVRRDFLKTSGLATLAMAGLPRRTLASTMASALTARPLVHADVDYKSVTTRAVDAATRAGAQYADVRVTYTRGRYFTTLTEREELAIGVRAIVNGFWGFASSPYLGNDSVDRVAREAVAQAKVNALGARGGVELTPIPVVANGRWSTPVVIDPFEVPVEEVLDWSLGMGESILSELAWSFPRSSITTAWQSLGTTKTEKILASSEGTYIHQTFYETIADFVVSYNGRMESVDCFPSVAGGWELVLHAPLAASAHRIVERLTREDALPTKTVDVGRYDLVFDSASMAALVGETLGAATQIDRALGYEANAGGTSYLGPDPFKFLGTAIGASSLNITANRSILIGRATTHWDDEGAVPDDFALIRDGVLVDYQTTREQAGWLAPWYQKRGLPVRSHGCARSTSALDLTLQHTPNLAMGTGTADAGFEELVASMSTGVAVTQSVVTADFQHVNGWGAPRAAFEIRNGRRVARLLGAGFLFRTPELWKNLSALGGRRAFEWQPAGRSVKGEPTQRTIFSIGAVPAIVKNLAVIELTRKA